MYPVERQDCLDILSDGVDAWNLMRQQNPEVKINLVGANLEDRVLPNVDFSLADLTKATLDGANLCGANLSGATLTDGSLIHSDLTKANMSGVTAFRAHLETAILEKAIIMEADLTGSHFWLANCDSARFNGTILIDANFREADLQYADFRGVNLAHVNLSKADLRKANLSGTSITETILCEANLEGADLSRARIYGVSAWNVRTDDETKQNDLVITRDDEPRMTVDNIKVAQFIHLIINNEQISDIIDTVATKAVLILGSFSHKQMPIIQAIQDKMRSVGYLPMTLDFEAPRLKNWLETVQILAHMCRFVIVDMTVKGLVLVELGVLPQISAPIQPILAADELVVGPAGVMFERCRKVFPTHRYKDSVELLRSLEEKLIPDIDEYLKKALETK